MKKKEFYAIAKWFFRKKITFLTITFMHRVLMASAGIILLLLKSVIKHPENLITLVT